MGHARGLHKLVHIYVLRKYAAVVPVERVVDFVVNHIAVDAAVGAVGIARGQKIERGGIVVHTFGCGKVDHGKRALTGITGMLHEHSQVVVVVVV